MKRTSKPGAKAPAAPAVPAGPMGETWNVYSFPKGGCTADDLPHNGKIRRRLVALGRDIECLQRFMSELPELRPILEKQPKKLEIDFLAFQVSIDMLWELLQQAGVIAGDRPADAGGDDPGPSAA